MLRGPAPITDLKTERSTGTSKTGQVPEFGTEGIFDGRAFDPADLDAYLAAFRTS